MMGRTGKEGKRKGGGDHIEFFFFQQTKARCGSPKTIFSG